MHLIVLLCKNIFLLFGIFLRSDNLDYWPTYSRERRVGYNKYKIMSNFELLMSNVMCDKWIQFCLFVEEFKRQMYDFFYSLFSCATVGNPPLTTAN